MNEKEEGTDPKQHLLMLYKTSVASFFVVIFSSAYKITQIPRHYQALNNI
jgi:hypothetical protein